MEKILSSEFIALASILLVAVGFLKFILYYKAFNIPIIEYVEPGEIISLFADNIATASLTIFVLAIPYIKIINDRNYIQDNLNVSLVQRLQIYVGLLSSLIIIGLILLFVAIVIVWRRPKINNFEILGFVTGWIIVVFVIPILVFEFSIRLGINVSPISIATISSIISFIFLILLATRNEIRKVKKYKFYEGVVVEFENNKFTSDTSEYFIGKTKSFIFFYSEKDKKSIAYSSDGLKSISYPHPS